MAYRYIYTLGDAQRYGLWLDVTCTNASCGRSRRVAPWRLAQRLGVNCLLTRVGERLRCRGDDFERNGCGQRGAIVRLVDVPTPPDPPPSPPSPGGNVVPLPDRRRASPADAAQPARERRRARGKKGPT